jgi:hypothetical protein
LSILQRARATEPSAGNPRGRRRPLALHHDLPPSLPRTQRTGPSANPGAAPGPCHLPSIPLDTHNHDPCIAVRAPMPSPAGGHCPYPSVARRPADGAGGARTNFPARPLPPSLAPLQRRSDPAAGVRGQTTYLSVFCSPAENSSKVILQLQVPYRARGVRAAPAPGARRRRLSALAPASRSPAASLTSPGSCGRAVLPARPARRPRTLVERSDTNSAAASQPLEDKGPGSLELFSQPSANHLETHLHAARPLDYAN